MKKNLTCIVCPMGCDLEVELNGREVVAVSGNTCPRGKVYAENECTNPQRTITTTMRCENGEVVAVKTDTAIPKDKMFECMEKINSMTVSLPVLRGQVIIEDVFGANVVATADSIGD